MEHPDMLEQLEQQKANVDNQLQVNCAQLGTMKAQAVRLPAMEAVMTDIIASLMQEQEQLTQAILALEQDDSPMGRLRAICIMTDKSVAEISSKPMVAAQEPAHFQTRRPAGSVH